MLLLFFKLLIAHALTDYSLQNDSMVTMKVRRDPNDVWWYYMAAHCLIQAGGVWLITANPWLALAEFVLHGIIDFAKSERWIKWSTDQWLHIACKAGYVLLWR